MADPAPPPVADDLAARMTAARGAASSAISRARRHAIVTNEVVIEAGIEEDRDPEFALNRVEVARSRAVRMLAALDRAERELRAWVQDWNAIGRPE